MMENDGTWMEHGLEQIEQVRTDFFGIRDAIRVNLSNLFPPRSIKIRSDLYFGSFFYIVTICYIFIPKP